MNLEKLEKKEPELEEKQVNDLFMSIVLGKDATEYFETSKGKFKIKFPRAKDLEDIGRKTAFRLNGIPARCFDIDVYTLMQQIATLDVLVIEGPEWYERAKRHNVNFSWQDIPSVEFIREVYALAYNFRNEVQQKIDEDQGTKDNGMDADERSNNDSESGVFEGLSGSARND